MKPSPSLSTSFIKRTRRSCRVVCVLLWVLFWVPSCARAAGSPAARASAVAKAATVSWRKLCMIVLSNGSCVFVLCSRRSPTPASPIFFVTAVLRPINESLGSERRDRRAPAGAGRGARGGGGGPRGGGGGGVGAGG